MKITIYHPEYWLQRGYSNEEAIELANQKKKETSWRCKEFWLLKGYSEEEAVDIIKEKQRTITLKRTTSSYKQMLNPYQREYWLQKGITDEQEITDKIQEQKQKTNPYLVLSTKEKQMMMANRKETYYSKTKEERELINKSRGINKEELIQKYGLEKTHEMTKNRGRRLKDVYLRYSKISEKFFNQLQILVPHIKLNYSVNEKWIRYSKNKGFFVDLLVDNTHKIIEFNGDFYHANPDLYQPSSLITISKSEKYKAKDIWEKDNQKITALKSLGYDVLIVWERNVKLNSEFELQRCVEFIKK